MNNRIDIHLMKRLLADYETLEETQPTIGNTMYINEQKRVMENRIMIAAHCDRYVNRQEWTFDKPLDPGIYAVKDYEDKSFDGVTIVIYRPNSEGLLSSLPCISKDLRYWA